MKSDVKRLTLVAALLAVGTTAAAQTPPPSAQTGPDAEITVDGLHRVDNSALAMVYVKPDLSLQDYSKVTLGAIRVAYQKDPGNRREARAGGMPEEANFALSPTQMDELKSLYREALVKKLTEDGGYQLVDAPGPDVLHIEAYIIDLVIKVPTQVTAGRQPSAVGSYASVTAVLELYDSESQEILARVADRGDPTLSASYATVEPAFVRADLTRLFEYWAGLLRQGLDQIREAGLH